MIVTFFGHSDFVGNKKYKEEMASILEEYHPEQVDFYLGGYGGFDGFALEFCQDYKKEHPSARLFYITPYLGETLERHRKYLETIYDGIIYPPIENVPKKYAISKRNRWMVRRSEMVIAYVTRHYGGAYEACAYAWRYIGMGSVKNLYKGKFKF